MSDVVEAMARVLCCGDDGTRPDRCSSDCSGIKAKIPQAHRLIRAVTERGGLVVGKMPGEALPESVPWRYGDAWDGIQETATHGALDDICNAYADGHNEALAAVRAAAVKVEGV